MQVTFDPAKNAKNITERGLPFRMVEEVDWSQAIIIEDTRKDYGEKRWRAFGYIDERLFAVVFTTRGDVMHVISLRKANEREVRSYGNQNK